MENPLQPETKTVVITNIDMHKVHKYLPRLLNGEAYRIEKWLPNILSTGGIMDREKYDYRVGQFKIKDRTNFDSYLTFIVQYIERMKRNKQSTEQQIKSTLDKAKQLQALMQQQNDADTQNVVLAFSKLKTAVDNHHEKNKVTMY